MGTEFLIRFSARIMGTEFLIRFPACYFVEWSKTIIFAENMTLCREKQEYTAPQEYTM